MILVRGVVGSLSNTTPGLLGCRALSKRAHFEWVLYQIDTVIPCSDEAESRREESFLTAGKKVYLVPNRRLVDKTGPHSEGRIHQTLLGDAFCCRATRRPTRELKKSFLTADKKDFLAPAIGLWKGGLAERGSNSPNVVGRHVFVAE